jgi:hypothetical protein
MRKYLMLFAMLAISFAVGLAWKAEAATWTSAARLNAVAESYSPIEKAQAAGNACPTGFTWGCRGGVCRCRIYR